MISQPSEGAIAMMVAPAVQWSNDLLRSHLSVLDDLAARIVMLSGPADATGRTGLAKRAIEGLVDAVDANLRASELAIGHGFIAAPEVVDGQERYMLWLQRDGKLIKRLRLNFDTSDLDAYDYVNMDWYTAPVHRHSPALTGPYLDYAGAGRLVITITAPVFVDDEFVGVVGTDLLAEQIEAQITRRLRSVDAEILLVSEERSVVATNSPRWMPGERLSIHPAQDRGSYAAVLALNTWTGWSLAVTPPPGRRGVQY